MKKQIAALGLVVWLVPCVASAEDPRIQQLIERVEKQDQVIEQMRRELEALRAERKPDEAEPASVTQAPADDREVWQTYRKDERDDPTADTSPPGIRLEISGQINQAMNVAGDGDETKAYFVDNENSNTRLRFAGVADFEGGPEIGPLLEIAFSPNPAGDVSQDREIAGDFFQVRLAELYALDERYGRLTFGRGWAAGDTGAFDLSIVSGAIMASGIADPMGGLQFTDRYGLTGVTLLDAFDALGGNRQNRVRYDTPMWGPVQVSLSAGADQRWDAALTFGGDYDRWSAFELGGLTMLGGVSIRDPNKDGVDFTVVGSWSVLHDPTGLNLTVSSGYESVDDGDTPYNVYGKLGWNAELIAIGPTGFGLDYTWTENVSADGDRGQSVGFAAVQVLERYGIELYSQVRWLSLDRHLGPSFHDLVVGTLGTRVRF
jgi:predicted porin